MIAALPNDESKEFEKQTRRIALVRRLAQRASLKEKGCLDKLATWFLSRAVAAKPGEEDFMRDDIVDAGIGFEAEELARYQSGGGELGLSRSLLNAGERRLG